MQIQSNIKISFILILILSVFLTGCNIKLTEDVITIITPAGYEDNSGDTGDSSEEISSDVSDESAVMPQESSVQGSSHAASSQGEPSQKGSSQEGSSQTVSAGPTVSQPAPTTAVSQPEKKLSGKLSVQIFVNENGVGEIAWTSILDSFETLNPDLELTTYIGPNVNFQLASKWTSGKGTPDVVLLDGKGLSEYTLSASGSFMDLTSWFKSASVFGSGEKIWDKINTNGVEYYQNKQYKAPLMFNCYGLWYDQNNLASIGVTVHSNFTSMLNNSAKMKSAGQTTLIYPGMYSNYLVWGAIMPAVAAYGQDFFDSVASGENPAAYKDSRFTAILNNLKTLSDSGYISSSATQDHIGAQSDWLNHRSTFVASGIWLEAEMKNSIPGTFDMRFTTAGLNKSGQKPGVVMMGVGVAISSRTQSEENAKSFLSYLYTDASLEKLAVSYGYSTISKKPVAMSKYSRTAQSVISYINSSDVNRVYKKSDWGNVGSTFNNVANQIALGTLSVTDGSNQLESAAKSN